MRIDLRHVCAATVRSEACSDLTMISYETIGFHARNTACLICADPAVDRLFAILFLAKMRRHTGVPWPVHRPGCGSRPRADSDGIAYEIPEDLSEIPGIYMLDASSTDAL